MESITKTVHFISQEEKKWGTESQSLVELEAT